MQSRFNRYVRYVSCAALIIGFQNRASDQAKIEHLLEGDSILDIYKYSAVNCETYKAILGNQTSFMINFFTDGPFKDNYYVTRNGYYEGYASEKVFQSFKKAFDKREQESNRCCMNCLKRFYGKYKKN